MKNLKFLLLLSFFTVFFTCLCYSWTITKELKADQEEKQWLVKVHPNDPQAHFELAITYAYTNKIEEGLNELKVVDKLDSKFAPKALKIYSVRVKMYPNDWKTRFRYAFTLYFNKKKQEAIKEFERVIKLDPKNVFAYGYIAIIYGELDEVSEAIDYCKEAIAIDSNVAALHLLLATGYYKKGQSGLGVQETFEALRLRALGY